MVKTTRIMFDLSDLTAVRAQCRNCRGEVVVTLDSSTRPLPQTCPWCNANWVQGRSETDVTRSFFELLKLMILNQQDHPLHLRFEMDDEDDG